MAVTERLNSGFRQVGVRTSTIATDIWTTTNRIVKGVSTHKKGVAAAAILTATGLTYEAIETSKQIVHEIPIYAQSSDFTTRELLYPKSNLRGENSIVAFNHEWLIPGRKTPDPASALATLTARRGSVEGIPEAENVMDEVIGDLNENQNDGNYDRQIGKIETIRQILLSNSQYKRRMEELGRKLSAFSMGTVGALFVLLHMGMGMKLKRQNDMEALKKKKDRRQK